MPTIYARFVFPTQVGMNRRVVYNAGNLWSIPHASGDEPRVNQCVVAGNSVFPTQVGMNRGQRSKEVQRMSIPHASGDEPQKVESPKELNVYSPRKWG